MTCDGSGTMDMCSTKVPHWHCLCGWPVEGRKYSKNQRCWLCNLEFAGEHLHRTPAYYETRERTT